MIDANLDSIAIRVIKDPQGYWKTEFQLTPQGGTVTWHNTPGAKQALAVFRSIGEVQITNTTVTVIIKVNSFLEGVGTANGIFQGILQSAQRPPSSGTQGQPRR